VTKPGDLLWVRESWRAREVYDRKPNKGPNPGSHVVYEADAPHEVGLDIGKLRPSIFMPRWASRIRLLVRLARVQRLQEITRDDAMAEGIVQTWGDFMGNAPAWAEASLAGDEDAHRYDNRTSVDNYAVLWDSLHQAEGTTWSDNPYIVALTFARMP
jgi:hypothetical protein